MAKVHSGFHIEQAERSDQVTTTMNGVHADYRLGDAGQVFGSTVLLSNPVQKVRLTDNASCGRQTAET